MIEATGDLNPEWEKVSETKWITKEEISSLLTKSVNQNKIYLTAQKAFQKINSLNLSPANDHITAFNRSNIRDSNQDVKNTRVVVASPRSGSTLMMRLLSGLSGVRVTSRTIVMGDTYNDKNSFDFRPDYRIYDGNSASNPHPVFLVPDYQESTTLISKEEYGNNLNRGTEALNECNYPMFRGEEDIFLTKPAFIFREPSSAFNSWLNQGWDRIEDFITTYKALYRDFKIAQSVFPETPVYVYENLITSQENAALIIEEIAKHWDLNYNSDCLRFDSEEYKNRFLYWDEKEKSIYHKDAHGLFKTLSDSNSILFNHCASKRTITADQKKKLMDELGDLYDKVANECISKKTKKAVTQSATMVLQRRLA